MHVCRLTHIKGKHSILSTSYENGMKGNLHPITVRVNSHRVTVNAFGSGCSKSRPFLNDMHWRHQRSHTFKQKTVLSFALWLVSVDMSCHGNSRCGVFVVAVIYRSLRIPDGAKNVGRQSPSCGFLREPLEHLRFVVRHPFDVGGGLLYGLLQGHGGRAKTHTEVVLFEFLQLYGEETEETELCSGVCWVWRMCGRHTSCNSNFVENLLVIPLMRPAKENIPFPYLREKTDMIGRNGGAFLRGSW